MKLVSQAVTRAVGRSVLKAKKNSPHILFVGGIVGVVSSTVLACRATLHLENALDEISLDLLNVKSHKATGSVLVAGERHEYTDKEYYRDLGLVYGKSASKLTKLYGPSIVVGVASISALTGSHVQLTRRNTALTATVAAVSKAYEDYRVRVQEEIGKERELDIYRGVHDKEIEEDGKKKIVKVADPNKFSPYARIFDEYNNNFKNSSEFNRLFLQAQQNYANHLLHARGHVFLNEIYDALGFEHSREGAVVGWVLNGDGDNYIDFGLFELESSRFINNLERAIWLDFNVDGVVYDKI